MVDQLKLTNAVLLKSEQGHSDTMTLGMTSDKSDSSIIRVESLIGGLDASPENLTLNFASHEGLAVIGTAENKEYLHIPILGSNSCGMKVKIEDGQYITSFIQGVKHYLEGGDTGVKFSKIKDYQLSKWKIEEDGSLKTEYLDQYLKISQIQPNLAESLSWNKK